jgi:hypothetical protein
MLLLVLLKIIFQLINSIFRKYIRAGAPRFFFVVLALMINVRKTIYVSKKHRHTSFRIRKNGISYCTRSHV